MKVLDPFAGYRLAMGHPIFHFSLFLASFSATVYYKPQAATDDGMNIEKIFIMLRWSHFTLFTLAMLSGFANIDSKMDFEEDKSVESTKEEVRLQKEKLRHRDGVWKIGSRICDTLSVFFYSSVIFYVQMSVYNNQTICDSDGCSLAPPDNSYMVWLYIEVYCFYIYMIAGVFFIIFHQLMGGVCVGRESEESDMRKTITDFIEYQRDNLIWFAFNLVMIFMPLICIFILNPRAENLDIEGAEMSYISLLSVCCFANLM